MSSSARLFQSESSALTENMDLDASGAADDDGDFDHYIDGIDNVGMDLNNIVDLVRMQQPVGHLLIFHIFTPRLCYEITFSAQLKGDLILPLELFYPPGLQGQKAVPGWPPGQPSGLRIGAPHVAGLLGLPR